MPKRNFLLSLLVLCIGLAVSRTLCAQQTLGVSLPATLKASWSDSTLVDTIVTSYVATQSGSITLWEAQFYPAVLNPDGSCPQPAGLQLKVLRPVGDGNYTVVSVGNVFDPLTLLQKRLGITTCPVYGTTGFVQDNAGAVLEFTEPVPLQILAGDTIAFTVTSATSAGYALEWTSGSGFTVLTSNSAPLGATVNPSGGSVQSGYESEIQVQVSMPTPVLTFLGTSLSSSGYQTYYNLSVSNWQLYSADLFAPTTPPVPCSDIPPNTTRINVDLYDATTNVLMVVFCGLTSPYGLTQLFFPEVVGVAPPSSVYILMTDTVTNTTVQSNALTIGPTPNGYAPIVEPLNPNGAANQLYSFASNLFNYKVTYPALSGSPSNVDLVLQPILVAQSDLDALLAGSGFAGAQLVIYDGTGGYGVLFRATCQDHTTTQPVTCPDTTGANTFYTSWNSPSGQSVTAPAYLKAPVGTKGPGWQNIFTAYSETRTDPTGSGRTKPSFSDFVFVQAVPGTAPTVAITSPQDAATYTLNEQVAASYSCSGSYVVGCIGDVPNGSNFDTSSLGSKTFTVNANVSSGPAGVGTVNYYVGIAITSPQNGTTYLLNQAVAANWSCTSDLVCTGTVPSGQNIDTSSAGSKTFTVTATSNNMSVGSQTVNYQVLPIAPTVSFAGAPATAAYQSTFNVTATTNASTAAAITPSGVCSVVATSSAPSSPGPGMVTTATVSMTSGTGTCTLTANWPADSNYLAATAGQLTAASTAGSTTKITSSAPNPSAPGQAVVASFTVGGNGSPSGTVTVAASTGESCTGTLSGSAGSCSLTFVTVGSRTLTASYSGDANFSSSVSAGVTQSVIGPLASLSSAKVNFGNVYLWLPAVRTVTLTNAGNAAMSVGNVQVTAGSDSDDFIPLSLCPSTLAAGKSCQIIVTFTADNDNYSPTGVLSVADNTYNSPQTVGLSATVINPKASLSAYSLSFGNQKAGTPSAAKTVTLTNTGTTPLVLSTLTVSGHFALVPAPPPAITCVNGGTLQPAASCTIAVTFTPLATGPQSGKVVITDNALVSPQIISLSGTGD